MNDPDHHGSPFEIAKLSLFLLLGDFNYCLILISIAKSFYRSFICLCLPNFAVSVMTCGGVCVHDVHLPELSLNYFHLSAFARELFFPFFPGALNQHEGNLLARLGRILKFISQFSPLTKLLFTIKHSSSELRITA